MKAMKTMKKRCDRSVFAPLAIEMRGLSSDEVLDRLWREGLIDATALERRAIRREVMRRVRSGETKCRAMDAVAARFGCSYEKVRAEIYRKHP